jgi:hypothetical protein
MNIGLERERKRRLYLFTTLKKIKKKGGFDTSCNYNRIDLFYWPNTTGGPGGPRSSEVTGHATVAPACPVPVASIEFSAQLLLVDSPLPTFFCLMLCSVFVSDSSPPEVAYADVENIPVNAAAIKTVAMVIALFITNK